MSYNKTLLNSIHKPLLKAQGGGSMMEGRPTVKQISRMPNKNYKPSDAVMATKATLAGLSMIPFAGYPASIANSVYDFGTGVKYAMDGQYENATEDITQGILGLLPTAALVGIGMKGNKIYKQLRGVKALKAASDLKSMSEAPATSEIFNQTTGRRQFFNAGEEVGSTSQGRTIPQPDYKDNGNQWLRNNDPFNPNAPKGLPDIGGGMTTKVPMRANGGMITDPMGQYAYPGQPTRIPGSSITMKGIDYPVMGIGSNGVQKMMQPGGEYSFGDSEYVDEFPIMANGGYTVSRSSDRKGKTHKVTGPDGSVKYFGDSKMGQHPKDPERKKAFYARHEKNLKNNPHFRAFARKTWEEGGEIEYMQVGGGKKKSVPVVNPYKDVDATAANTFRNLLPVPDNVAQLAAKQLFGDARMNNNSLSDNQKLMLWNVIQNAKKRTGSANSGTEYEDYGNLGYGTAEEFGDWFNRGKLGLMETMGKSIANPGFKLASTIGRGRYWQDEKDPETVYYTDVYDWNPGEKNFKGSNTYQNVRNYVRSTEDKDLNADKNEKFRMNFKLTKAEIDRIKKEQEESFFEAGGQMIKRADGSYSKRGLWDNIRANKGSGKKPTKEMLEQEKKINMKKYGKGGTNNQGFDALPEYVQAKILSEMGYGGYVNPYMADGGEPNGEMAMGQMAAVSDKMSKLMQFIRPDQNLDPWIASKLAVMDHSADAINDYLMYGPEGQQEEKGLPKKKKGGSTYANGVFYQQGGERARVDNTYNAALTQARQRFEQDQLAKQNAAVANPYYTNPYSVIAYPDRETAAEGDSVRLFPGQTDFGKTPYMRDLGNLAGVTPKMSNADIAKLMKSGKARGYSDSTYMMANPDFMNIRPKRQKGGEVLEVTPEQAEMLRQQGYQFEIVD